MTSLRTLSVSLLAILALALPACGGGGGGGAPTGGVGTPTGQLPAIVSTSPANNDADIDSDSIIEIEFDNDLDPTTIPVGAIQVTDADGAVFGDISYDAGRRSLVFSPSTPMVRDARHNVQVLPGIGDVDGNVRTEGYAFAFDTAPLANEPAVPHENETEDTQLLGFAVNGTGRGASLMAVDFGNRTDIVIRPYSSATGFGTPINVDSFVGNVTASTAYSIAVDASGKGIAAWRVDGPNGPDVFAVPFDAQAGTAGSTHTLDASNESSDIPMVVMGTNGDGLIAWSQRASGGDRKTWAAGYEQANGFDTSHSLEPNGGDCGTLKPAISRFGQAILAWSLRLGNDYATRARTWKAGSWSVVHTVSYTPNTRTFPEKCLVSNNGECMVIMNLANTPTPNYRGLRTKRFRPTGLSNPGWQALTQPTGQAGENFKVDAALISGGNVFVAYAMDAPGGAFIEAREYSTAGWSDPIQVTSFSPDSFSGCNVRCVSRGDRYTMVDWAFDNGVNKTRRAALYHNANNVYRDVLVPAKVNSGFGVIDNPGNVRFVSRVNGVSNALETVVVEVDGTVSPVERVDNGTSEFTQNYLVSQDASGRGAILWEERQGPVNTPYDVFHALID